MELQSTPLTDKTVKTINMVDLVGKKHCSLMVEINFAPGNGISKAEIERTELLIIWEDGTQGRYQLLDIFRFTLSQDVSCITWLSHGMDLFNYLNWLKEKYPDLDGNTKMARYYYHQMIP